MRIVAFSNVKGGVGKTTTAVNLAYLAGAGGRRTVLWDLDPQGAATYILGGEENPRASARRLVSGKRGLAELVAPTGYANLLLLAADRSYRNFDVRMSACKHPTRQLMIMMRPMQETCDLLVLDCPPGMSLLTENVLRAADAIVVPTVPAPLSLRMLDELQAFVAKTGWPDIEILPFFSMVDRRRSLHEEIIAEARRRFPRMLATEVPDWSEVERMTIRRAPLPAFAPHSQAAQIYTALWREVASRVLA